MYEDIAESKQADEQIESLARFPAENPSPVLRIATDGTLLYANDASESLLKEWNCRVGQVVAECWRQWVSEAFESGSEKQVETEHAGRTFSFAIAPVAEAGYANIYARDITEHKEAEEALQESEERFNLAVKGSNDGMWDWPDVNSEKEWWSSRWYELLGYEDGEIEATFSNFKSFLHPDDLGRTEEAVVSHFERRVPFDLEYRLRTKLGEYRWFRGRGQALWDADGKPCRMSGSIRDITDRKQAQEQIENLAKFPSENPNPVLRIARDGTLLYANDASQSLLDEWSCQVGQAVGECWRQWVAEAFESGSEKRVETEHAGRTFSFAIAPVAEAGYANIYARDITERKQAEDELRAERDKLDSVFAAMNDGIYIVNQEYDIEYVNPVLVADFGPYEGRKCYAYFHDRQEVCPWCKNPDVFAGKTVRWEWFSSKTGKTYDLIDTPLKNPDGSISKLEIFRDITDRKKAEEQREILLHDMGERNKELACMYSVAKSIRDRETAAEILQDAADCIPPGWHYPEITRGKVRFGSDEFVSEPFEETEWKQTSDIIVNGKCCGSIEVYYIEERPELDEGPFMAEERNLIDGIARAVSEGLDRKEAEDERERLLKTVAAKNRELQDIIYIASHDLKTPLVNILGFSGELLQDLEQLENLLGKDKLEQSEKAAIENLVHNDIPQELKFISSGARMLKGLIDGMLQVSRIGSAEYTIEPLNMNELIKEVVDGLEFGMRDSGVSVTVEELPDCLGDAPKTGQIFGNLISNALKYLDPGRKGVIRIRGRCEDGRSEYCVQDNGIGIDAAHQQKVFEIFHRLNPSDDVGGEGLGLTIVVRILDQMEGAIRLESEPGKGSKFFVSLPST